MRMSWLHAFTRDAKAITYFMAIDYVHFLKL